MDATTLWCFLVTVFGFVLIAVLLYKNKRPSTWFLAFFLFIYTYGSLVLFLFITRYLLEVPYLYRTGWFFLYISAPALLFYVIYLFNEQRPLQWKDALHLIPAMVYLVDLMPYFLLSNEHKREIVKAVFENKALTVLFREGWIMGSGMHVLLKHAIALGYILYIAVMVRRKKKALGVSKLFKNAELRQWLWLVLTYFALYSILGIFTYFISYTQYPFLAILWGNSFVFLSCALTLLLKPSILYGLKMVALRNNFKPTINFDQLGYKYREGLRSCIEKKLFLKQNVKLENIADEVGVQAHLLSAFINSSYGMRITDFINWFRIMHVKELLARQENKLLTLESIGESAGFSNRTTFLAAFKKFTGVTPSEFVNGARNEKIEKQFHADTAGLPVGIPKS